MRFHAPPGSEDLVEPINRALAALDDHQTSLFEPTNAERYAAWRSTEAGRVVYHEAHLRALQLRRRGLGHYGIAAIVESIRYDRAVEIGVDDAGYRINNNHRAYLARELMAADRRLRGFFRTR